MSSTRKLLISVLAVGVVMAAWFLSGYYGLVSRLLLPSPAEVFDTAADLWNEGYVRVPLWRHIGVSLARALAAFVAAVASGVPIGLLMGMFPGVSAALDPFAGSFSGRCRNLH